MINKQRASYRDLHELDDRKKSGTCKQGFAATFDNQTARVNVGG